MSELHERGIHAVCLGTGGAGVTGTTLSVQNRRPFGTWILENGAVTDDLVLSLGEARRLAVRSQHLAGPPPTAGIAGMRQVLRGLRVLQLDPVNVVARSHLLVLWSRLGGFNRDDLNALLWREHWLFEYWAHAASIVLTEDYPIHSVMMRAYRTIAETAIRLLRDAGTGGGAANRPDRTADGPEAG